MEMEMEVKDELSVAVERLAAAANVLEQAADRLAGLDVSSNSGREFELEEKLRAAEATIATLRAEAGRLDASRFDTGRKTLPAGVLSLLAKQGEDQALDAGKLDAALVGLSMEQRIAVKSQLLRAGFIG
jgi:hypothetical protein